MSDTHNTDAPTQDELTALKARADLMGVSYHPSIGLEKLREKVNAALAPADEDEVAAPAPDPQSKNQKALREAEERRKHILDATRLIRIRVSCMNPNKKELEGQIITVGNSVVGTLKKFVPFNIEDGWYVPHMIYETLRDAECQIFMSKKDARGNTYRAGKMIKEFAIEILPDLTQEELKDLAQRQAMAKSLD